MAAEEHGLSSPVKIHPKNRWLPQYDGRAMEPIPPSNNAAGRPQFGLVKVAAQAEHHTNPSGTDGRAGCTRSMYISRRYTSTDDDGRLSGHYRADHARSEHRKRSPPEVLHSLAQHRGAAHPLCFTDEVMEHEFPDGFKPINIESYDGTTNPAVWIEDYLLHIDMARGDDL